MKLLKLSADDAGVYMCKASNRAGIDTSPKVEVDHYRRMFSRDLKYGPDGVKQTAIIWRSIFEPGHEPGFQGVCMF